METPNKLAPMLKQLSASMNDILLANKAANVGDARIDLNAAVVEHGMYIFYRPLPDVEEYYGFLSKMALNDKGKPRALPQKFKDGDRFVIVQPTEDATRPYRIIFAVLSDSMAGPSCAYLESAYETAAHHAYTYLETGHIPDVTENKTLN